MKKQEIHINTNDVIFSRSKNQYIYDTNEKIQLLKKAQEKQESAALATCNHLLPIPCVLCVLTINKVVARHGVDM